MRAPCTLTASAVRRKAPRPRGGVPAPALDTGISRRNLTATSIASRASLYPSSAEAERPAAPGSPTANAMPPIAARAPACARTALGTPGHRSNIARKPTPPASQRGTNSTNWSSTTKHSIAPSRAAAMVERGDASAKPGFCDIVDGRLRRFRRRNAAWYPSLVSLSASLVAAVSAPPLGSSNPPVRVPVAA